MRLIEFEQTPNPDALRVLPGRAVSAGPPRQFERRDAAAEPLAAALFAIPGIARIMIAGDFVTVIRDDDSHDWGELKPRIAIALDEFLELAADPIIVADADLEEKTANSDIEQQIEDVLDRWVRPMLAADGGETVLVRFDPHDGIAWVRMEGACGGCPSGTSTLKYGIERTIRQWVPEVTAVAVAESDVILNEDPKARFRDWIAAKWGRQ